MKKYLVFSNGKESQTVVNGTDIFTDEGYLVILNGENVAAIFNQWNFVTDETE